MRQKRMARWHSLPFELAVLSLLLVPAGAEETRPVRCDSGCRGLGVEKVKAGDEHCAFLPRERKERALTTACELAEVNQAVLKSQAEGEAVEQCGDPVGRKGCLCVGELRRWENTYTHVLSQRCWTECGWAYLLECERDSENRERDEEGG